MPKVNGSFVAGDVRATENPGLSSLHTVFVREHNRIAGALAALDATLSDEELYQRTRRYCYIVEQRPDLIDLRRLLEGAILLVLETSLDLTGSHRMSVPWQMCPTLPISGAI